jgi:hypothetical protein
MIYRKTALILLTAMLILTGLTGCGMFNRVQTDANMLIGSWTFGEQAYTNGDKVVYNNGIRTFYTNGTVESVGTNSSYGISLFKSDHSYMDITYFTNGTKATNSMGSWSIDDVNMVLTMVIQYYTNITLSTNIYSNYTAECTYVFNDASTLKFTQEILSYTVLMENNTPTNYDTDFNPFNQYGIEYVILKK